MNPVAVVDRRQLILVLWILLTTGFVAITSISYQVSKRAIREALIGQDLPLTSSNIYSEIQKDLVRPVLISSTMAHDTFVRDWVLDGERDVTAMARFLKEVKERHGAFSSFFVSDLSSRYYTGAGVLKRISPFEPRDAWYYRVRAMATDYEINVDPDLANNDKLTIFINYRVFDYAGRYIGATGIGLTADAVRRLITEYQQRFDRTIYFVDARGHRIEFGNKKGHGDDLRQRAGLGALVPQIIEEQRGSWQYEADGDNFILHVNYLPELKWFLFVEQNETIALAEIRRTLYLNLAISILVTLIVVFLIHLALMRYQRRLEQMASTDKLTGLLNRHAFGILTEKLLAEYRREPRPIGILLVDVDHFKSINDHHGHRAGDVVLSALAERLQAGLRASDFAVRWGGEEFLLVLKACDLGEAQRIAEKLRQSVEQTPVVVEGKPVAATVSIGVAAFDGTETPEKLVDRADQALYRAKHAGRNRVEVG